MRSAPLSVALAFLLRALAPGAALAQGTPLDVTNTASRPVFVQVENSFNFAIVGQSFGPPFPATWSVAGNIGTLVIAPETHEQMFANWWPDPVPGGFTAIVIHIDRTTLEATSEIAHGEFDDGSASMQMTLQPLDTTAVGGFAGPILPRLFCTSQQTIYDYCWLYPQACGDTCTLVPGSAYDPATGRVNLIGIESIYGCDGPCQGPFPYFAGRGDMRFTEAQAVPALPWSAAAALVALLAACTGVVVRKPAAALALLVLLPASAARAQGTPLDVTNLTARPVFVQVESSTNFATVGQTFGQPFPASWSVSGNTGRVVISSFTHEQMRLLGNFVAVPGSFTPRVIEIDLATLEATSAAAGGAYLAGQLSYSFSQNPLSTTGTGGFVSPTGPHFFCTSQAQVDQFCQFAPQFCGQTCALVAGAAYDLATGRINLIGVEDQTGCDGGVCFGPFPFFTQLGDLRFTEGPPVPALSGEGALLLFALLAAGARLCQRRDAAPT